MISRNARIPERDPGKQRWGVFLYLLVTLLFFLCLLAIPSSLIGILYFPGNTPSSTTPQADLIAIPSITATGIVVTSEPSQTAIPQTNTPESTQTVAFTSTVPFTPTMTFTPQPPLPVGIPACIPTETKRETGRVLGIVDGDTINVEIDGQIVAVRYIGVDAPEYEKEFHGKAAQANQNLVYLKDVVLVSDMSDSDGKGNLLRYVIVGDVLANYEIVNQGYARADPLPPDTSCSSLFDEAQNNAQIGNLGIWFVPSVP